LGRKFNGFEDYSKVEEIQDLQQVLEKKKTFWVEFQVAVLPAISAHSLEIKEKQEERLNKRKQFKPLQTGDTVMATDQTRSSKWEPVYEGPYIVEKRNSGGTYTLKNILGDTLPRSQTIDMLQPVHAKIEDLEQPPSLTEIEETKKAQMSTTFSDVKNIVDHHMKADNSGFEYLVHWKRSTSAEDEWVDARDFVGTKVIQQYWKSLKKKKNIKEKIGSPLSMEDPSRGKVCEPTGTLPLPTTANGSRRSTRRRRENSKFVGRDWDNSKK